MIRPCYSACAVMAVLLVTVLAGDAYGVSLGPWLLGGFMLASAIDLLWAAGVRLPSPVRHLPDHLGVGRAQVVSVTLTNPHGHVVRLTYNECHSGKASVRTFGLPVQLTLPARHQAQVQYTLEPQRRGALPSVACELHVRGPLGLWSVRHRLAAPAQGRAGQNFRMLDAWAPCPLPTKRNVPDLVILLDTGPPMGGMHQGERLLDCAMDAAIAVACAALAYGAQVAVHFDGNPNRRYLCPRGGSAQLQAVYQALLNVQASTHPTDWRTSSASVLQRSHPKAIVLLITRLPEAEPQVLASLTAVSRERTLVIADIAERPLAAATCQPVRNEAQIRAYCSVVHTLGMRLQVAGALRAAGLDIVQVTGDRLAETLVERYARALQ